MFFLAIGDKEIGVVSYWGMTAAGAAFGAIAIPFLALFLFGFGALIARVHQIENHLRPHQTASPVPLASAEMKVITGRSQDGGQKKNR